MTDHTEVPLVATGDWIDAAWLNQYLRDNFRAFQQGFAAGGDMPYAVDDNTIGALSKPSVASLMEMDGDGVPLWTPKFGITGLLHTAGMVTSTTQISTTSTSLTDVTNMSLTLTLTQTCTVYALAFGQSRTDGGVYYPTFALSINGTSDPSNLGSHRSPEWESPYQFFTMYKVDSVAAGSCVVKLRFKISNAADTIYFKNGRIIAFAFVE